jgi:hypothetical protein
MPSRHVPLLDRMVPRIEFAANGCWVWTGTTSRGYGLVWQDGRRRMAHRALYEAVVGPLPEDLKLDHLCRNKACINPDHLEPVTEAENIRRGISPSAVNARKDRCPRGHVYDYDHTSPSGRRTRGCLRCRRAGSKRWYEVHGHRLPERVA